MIDLYYWPTPNGWKISVALEEMELPYDVKYVNIGRGEQFEPEFLRISPNNRMPAIVDHDPPGGGEPISVFESGAILIYLAEKTGRFLPGPDAPRGRKSVLEWLMWQMGGLGPMLGQNHHFRIYAPEPIADAYSIADMACWGWVVPHDRQGIELDDFPNVRRWYDAMKERPAVQRGFEVGMEIRKQMAERGGMDEEAKKVLFGQSDTTLRGEEGGASR